MQNADMDLISIIITTHNGVDTIERAVKSVLTQDYLNKEIIVIDDNGIGTSEQLATERVLYSYIVQEKIIYHPHEINRNGSVARNTGIKLAHGKYIGFLDDDDIYMPGKISRSLNKLINLPEDWGGVYTDIEINYGERGRYKSRYNQEGDILFEVLSHVIFINPSVIIMRKIAIEQIGGFDETFIRHQDWEFTARFSDRFKIAHLDMIGSIYNCQFKRHYDPSSANFYREYYIRKMKPIISKLPRFKQEVIYYRNAIDLCGFSIRNRKKCIMLISRWDESVRSFTFYYSMLLTVIERLKFRLNKV